jgi:hypothetical protein
MLPGKFSIILICIFISLNGLSQTISGTIKDKEGKILPFASVIVKGTTKGAVANSQGKYSITLNNGSYTIVCQYVGYKPEEQKITVEGKNLVLDFELSVQDLTMEEVVIRRGVDPAIEIIKETIKKRDFYNTQVDSFTVDVYIKGLMRMRAVPDKVFGQKVDKKEMEKEGFDSLGKGILFLSESLTNVSYKVPDKIKYRVISSRVSGGGFGISFPIFINFYTNNVNIFGSTISPRGFVSPIADNAFHYYNFKYEGNFFQNGKMIDQIKVTPKRKNEPTFNGYVYIIDGEWRFHSLELTTTKNQQLELLDTIMIRQMHAPVTEDIWRTQNQVVYLTVKTFGFDITGNFLNVYNDYNLQPNFEKKYFNRVIMTYDSTFNKKDSSYWSQLRPVPLEPDEKKDYAFKDSAYKYYRDSMYTQRNIDSLRSQRRPVKIRDPFLGGVNRYLYSSKRFSRYRLEPLLPDLEYNTVEGVVVEINQSLSVTPRKGKVNYEIFSTLRYGFSNQHFNPSLGISFKPKGDNFRNRFYSIAGGKKIAQFNRDNPIDPFTNAISTLVYRNNWMKIYESWFGEVQYNNRLENGLVMNISASYEDRIPLENTDDFSFFRKDKNTFTPNHPYELAHIPFEKHQATVATINLSFQPGQRYIQMPHGKIPLGSKYPTLELQYVKGIEGLFGSEADFNKWKFTVHSNVNLKLKGLLRYRLSIGGFIETNRVDIPDFRHFIGNETVVNKNYLNSFQLASYYQYSNTEKFYALVHVEHHFNGLLTNKIPLLNKLKWNLVAGSNTFYVNNRNYYAEVFVGLENIFKLLRFDFVTGYQSLPGNRVGIRMGMGGALGAMAENIRFERN